MSFFARAALLATLGLLLAHDSAAQQRERDTTAQQQRTRDDTDTTTQQRNNGEERAREERARDERRRDTVPRDTSTVAGGDQGETSPPAAAEAGTEGTAGIGGSAQLTVGVTNAPPFAIKGTDGAWQGIAIHLWRAVADSLNLTYQLRELSAKNQIARVADGSVDLALTAAATAAAERRVDFAPAYYTATIGVAGSRRRSIMGMVGAFFSPRFFWIVAGLAVLLLAMGTLMWLVERSVNDDHFGGERNALHGIGSGFWWAGVTMTTIGYGDKTPTTFLGRLLAMLWMLIAMAVTAILTASLVSIVSGSGSGSALTAPGQLRSMRVGTEGGSPGAAFLKENGVTFRKFASPVKGLRALEQDSIEAFVYSTPVLKHLTSQRRDLTTAVQSTGRLSQRYAFAYPEDDPRAETLSRIVLARIDTGAWHDLLKRYLQQGKGSSGG